MTHPMHSWSVDIILYFEISYVVAIVIQRLDVVGMRLRVLTSADLDPYNVVYR